MKKIFRGFALAGLGVATLVATASQVLADGVSLSDCRVRIDTARGRLRAKCDVTSSQGASDGYGNGVTVNVGDTDSSECLNASVTPVRVGHCWRSSADPASPITGFRLCDSNAGSGQYRLVLRIGSPAHPANLGCLDQPDIALALAFAPQSGTNAASTGTFTCERDSESQACTVPRLASSDPLCVNPSADLSCDEPASRSCANGLDPYDCTQPTKKCDPRPRAANRHDKSTKCFPVATPGAPLTDSVGNVLGALTDDRVRLNFGMHRVIGGDTKVLAFVAATNQGTRTGWVSLSAIRDLDNCSNASDNRCDFMRTQALPEASNRIVGTRFIVGDGVSDTVRNYCFATEGHAYDYLGRAYNEVNLAWSTPGEQFGGPTAEMYPNNQGRKMIVTNLEHTVPLYPCGSGNASDTMTFVYGYVEQGRWGWMARNNLVSACGDGVPDPGEECDHGSQNGHDGSCAVDCTFPPHCVIECSNHSGGLYPAVASKSECGGFNPCGVGQQFFDNYNGCPRYVVPSGGCGVRNRLWGRDHFFGPAPTFVCARCANRCGHYRASGENPFGYLEDCQRRSIDLGVQLCQAHQAGGLLSVYVGDCPPWP